MQDKKWAAGWLAALAYGCAILLTVLIVLSHGMVTTPLGVEPGTLPLFLGFLLVLAGAAVSLWEAVTQTKRWSAVIGSGLTTVGALTAVVLIGV
ncbi:hypothetical protein [Brachybacterium paraconglomeratum]|uniref:hypothetical protein n=1 Tax=Brachybacterium paraconglomeratum TaxID=173362 RepID=UPI0022E34358|nr:hypothetical protein [Brachybacterium paraconglomeratum]